MRIKLKILLLASGFFFVSLAVVGFSVQRTVVSQFEHRLGENAMNIAHSVAMIPEVQQWVGAPGGEKVIQPIADGIRRQTGAEYVVVMDLESRRYSHPVPGRIGEKFVGGDEGPVFSGKTYISKATGTLGPSMRAFVPIYREGSQVGAVSVGILIERIRAMLHPLNFNLFIALALGLAVGLAGASFLAQDIKKETLGLEPHEIAQILQEHEAVLQSIREGIVAVDREGRITLMNSSARSILDVNEDYRGRDVEEVIPKTRLKLILESGEPEYDQEQTIRNARILTNRVPIKVKGKVVGALASFRDMTEMRCMAEELTGVKAYVEAYRVQAHEFLNKLQTISGLVQLGEGERAVDFISETVTSHQSALSFVTRRIKDPSIAGLLLGKSGRCRELGITFRMDPDSFLGPDSFVDVNALVVILGNLVDNAVEAVMKAPKDRRTIDFSIFDESDKMLVSVKDTGCGIPAESQEAIFDRDFTTKGPGRGLGLSSIKSLVDAYEGEINVTSVPGEGTEFVVILTNRG